MINFAFCSYINDEIFKIEIIDYYVKNKKCIMFISWDAPTKLSNPQS